MIVLRLCRIQHEYTVLLVHQKSVLADEVNKGGFGSSGVVGGRASVPAGVVLAMLSSFKSYPVHSKLDLELRNFR